MGQRRGPRPRRCSSIRGVPSFYSVRVEPSRLDRVKRERKAKVFTPNVRRLSLIRTHFDTCMVRSFMFAESCQHHGGSSSLFSIEAFHSPFEMWPTRRTLYGWRTPRSSRPARRQNPRSICCETAAHISTSRNHVHRSSNPRATQRARRLVWMSFFLSIRLWAKLGGILAHGTVSCAMLTALCLPRK
ncbi:hypothetical protein LMG24235_05092 [Paraburkholderia sabiae]|nr:hypothetical protein LMG24235_05092 [Paraburkholderia sabiae]